MLNIYNNGKKQAEKKNACGYRSNGGKGKQNVPAYIINALL
jgi:hypothetical protein